MKRYRLVFRHGTPMRLTDFIEECRGHLTGWAGKRVLLVLNTRRSARRVRDALADDLPPGMALEFLSADVTPRDRLAAIGRIKEGRACLVVSTQCIEAGVDIDMDLVVRDFAPLDSLIQVAGRCNRHGLRERGTVEVVRLLDDDSGREYAGMIYDDKILLQVTLQTLGEATEVAEQHIFPLTRRYFEALSREKDTGETVTSAWAKWEETKSARRLLRGAPKPQDTFVVIANDPSLEGDLQAAVAVKDRWQRRRVLRRLARRVAENTVTVYRRPDLDPAQYASPFPPGKKGDDVWFWLLHEGYYTAARGLDVAGGPEEAAEGWGAIL
jgi:CRISPR-associated endonuclease/helicase Cas3